MEEWLHVEKELIVLTIQSNSYIFDSLELCKGKELCIPQPRQDRTSSHNCEKEEIRKSEVKQVPQYYLSL